MQDDSVERLEHAVLAKPPSAVSDHEWQFVAAAGFERATRLGGYQHFFVTCPGYVPVIRSTLETIGCPRTAAVTADAIAALGLPAPERWQDVEDAVRSDAGAVSRVLEACDARLASTGENIAERLRAWLEANRHRITPASVPEPVRSEAARVPGGSATQTSRPKPSPAERLRRALALVPRLTFGLLLPLAVALELWAVAADRWQHIALRVIAGGVVLIGYGLVAAAIKDRRERDSAFSYFFLITAALAGLLAGVAVGLSRWIEPFTVGGVLLLAIVTWLGALIALPVVVLVFMSMLGRAMAGRGRR